MATILVVDDSEADRELARTLLQKDPKLSVETAVDGLDALASIERWVPDLVLTDLVMPNMDGLEFVGTLRQRHPHIPSILMTSLGSEKIAVRALQAGAASYVPKAELAYDLLDNVRAVLAVSYRARDQARLMESMLESESVFALQNSTEIVPALVNHLQSCVSLMGLCDPGEQVQLGVAISEAVNNAMQHGNLEVDSALRERSIDAYHEAVQARARQAPYRDRKVHITAKLSRDEARFVVRDEGPGFDPGALPDPLHPENLEKASGRGVLLMRAFMDDVQYNHTGNEVTLVLRRKRP